ncbi:hypothetical protein BG261_07255 [Floricoccus tropicus]|uniref:CAAX prenyl protease 2/Lysostaphin resistance protein A-like domain-containing protein n=1 Tax=Floricoccus tropicus TaxID=1859473 RepID=A0A1E8GM21_9LACT|nr:CPBP family intramembrane glutamic endopeptidase [Floricoccus tropicus]OFI48683.1 hypothetical protein BG261_07255 [Floricoccus tropicus]
MKKEKTLSENLFDLIKIFGFIIIVSLPLSLIMIASSLSTNSPIYIDVLISIILLALILFIIKLTLNYYRNVSKKQLLTLSKKDVLKDILYLLAIRIIVVILTIASSTIFKSDTTSNDQLLLDFGKNTSLPYFIAFILCIIIIAPLFEELVFRGIFPELFFQNKYKNLTMIVSSAIFASLHGFDNIISFSMYFLMGLILYLAYQRKGNLSDSILVHALNNSIGAIALIVMYFTIS